MFGSLLRPKLRRGQTEHSPFSASPWFRAHQGRQADESSDDAPELQGIDEDMDEDWEEEEDGPMESTPLLPMFSASHLGRWIPNGTGLHRGSH